MGTEEAGYRTCGFKAGVCSLVGGGEPTHSCVLSMGVPLGLVVQTSGQVSASTN